MNASAEKRAPGGEPFFSLVTTCKGRAADLAASLPSWLALGGSPFEIVVVDFDCPQKAGEVATGVVKNARRNPWLTGLSVVRLENRPFFNLNEARNAGLSAARGTVALLLDADVRVNEPDLLKKLMEEFATGALFVGSIQFLPSECEEASLYCRYEYGLQPPQGLVVPIAALNPGLTGTAAFLVDRAKEVGLYDARINEAGYGSDDVEFYLRYANGFRADVPGDADSFMGRLRFFPEGSLFAKENTEEEKHRFYRMDIHDSATVNRSKAAETLAALASASKKGAGHGDPLFLGLGWPPPSYSWVARWFPIWYHYWLGIKLAERGELEARREVFREELFADSGETFGQGNRLRYLLGSLAHRLSRFDRSGPLFSAILSDKGERSPHILAGANFFLGLEMVDAGQTERAKALLDACLALNPGHRGAAAALERIRNSVRSAGN